MFFDRHYYFRIDWFDLSEKFIRARAHTYIHTPPHKPTMIDIDQQMHGNSKINCGTWRNGPCYLPLTVHYTVWSCNQYTYVICVFFSFLFCWLNGKKQQHHFELQHIRVQQTLYSVRSPSFLFLAYWRLLAVLKKI